MIRVDIKDALDQFNKLSHATDGIINRVYKYFVAITPIRSGNARRHTTLHDGVIEANYPYASRLDEGYSKQAPQGMTRPADRELQRLIKRALGK